MAMEIDVVALMDEQEAEVEAQKERKAQAGNYKPIFLLLSDKQKVIFRPLVNLSGSAVMYMHNKFHPSNAAQSINATCAKEIGQPCQHCANAADDKKLTAARTFMLPIFVYQIWYTKAGVTNKGVPFKAGDQVTYKENGVDVPVGGVRILRLTFDYGAIVTAAQALKTRFKDGDDLRRRDFTLERMGSDQSTKYILDAKDPSQFKERVAPVTIERIRERVLEACPPLVASGVAQAVSEAMNDADDATTNVNGIEYDGGGVAVF